MKGLTWRIILVTFTVLLSVYLLVPTYVKFATGHTIPKAVKADDPWWYHLFPAETLKLGLDLMGGLHLVLGVDFDEVNRDAVSKIKNQLKDYLVQEKIEGVTVEATNDL